MNRQPRLEAILKKLHVPDFMFLSPQPAVERVRRVSHQERQYVTAEVSGRLAITQMVEFDHEIDNKPPNASPENAVLALHEPERISLKEQN